MGNNWPLLPINPAWHCSPRIPTSPGSNHKCTSMRMTRWPHWIEPLKYWESRYIDTHFTSGPHARACFERASRASKSWKPLLSRAVATRQKPWWPRPPHILNYATPIYLAQLTSSHLDKLEVIQNKVLQNSFFVSVHLELCTPVISSPPLSPPSTTPSSGPPAGLISLHLEKPESKRWRSHILSYLVSSWRSAWRRRKFSFGQMPPTRPDDWGDRPVSGAQQGTVGCPPTSGPSRTVAASVL